MVPLQEDLIQATVLDSVVKSCTKTIPYAVPYSIEGSLKISLATENIIITIAISERGEGTSKYKKKPPKKKSETDNVEIDSNNFVVEKRKRGRPRKTKNAKKYKEFANVEEVSNNGRYLHVKKQPGDSKISETVSFATESKVHNFSFENDIPDTINTVNVKKEGSQPDAGIVSSADGQELNCSTVDTIPDIISESYMDHTSITRKHRKAAQVFSYKELSDSDEDDNVRIAKTERSADESQPPLIKYEPAVEIKQEICEQEMLSQIGLNITQTFSMLGEQHKEQDPAQQCTQNKNTDIIHVSSSDCKGSVILCCIVGVSCLIHFGDKNTLTHICWINNILEQRHK